MSRSVKVVPIALLVAGALTWTSGQRVKAVSQSPAASVRLLSLGTASLSANGSSSDGFVDSTGDFVRGDDELVDRRIPAVSNAPARVPADHVPAPQSLEVVTANPRASGFAGLTHRDQRLAGTGPFANTQFSLEPPDQALCVGNGFVVEAVNTAVRVRSTSGTNLTDATALNQFFGLAPEVIRSTPPVYGDFTSDPRCYFDPTLHRFFLTLLQADVDPATSDLTGPTSVLIAVSQTGDPTASWYRFKLNTTNDGTNGTPSHPSCPCLGDQPLIGADANGFYVTTNEFATNGPGFNGAQIYAMSKSTLATGAVPPVVLIGGQIPLAEGIAYSVQPATTPSGSAYATAQNGTEYFVSSLEFTGSLDNRIAVWAMTNTASLNNASPAVTLSNVVVPSQVYGMGSGSMPGVEQADGPRPLAASLVVPGTQKPRLELLDANDDRMNQVVFAGGRLYSAVNTVVKTENAPTRNGIAYFVLAPNVSGGPLSATMANQGYISVNRAHAVFPSVAVNGAGVGAIAFTLSSKDMYPSAAYATIDASGAVGEIHIAAPGELPEDGFSGYAAFGGARVSRWGDYSAAVADESGHIWMATEFIPDSPRTSLANWGTYIVQLVP